ncbi:methyl-accepting chemotaxis protein [Chitiniphilus purpureus]|uniref:Methyl-accepting chemotaxis protein n=1 Tax=Chitiniphilus purpureus TaxID=2981137 RepID=A0ABY6DLA9_9NEIS|nr:methyl-accepting chemotaxis protein [Chitiniphilus sp. CD1]UXY15018.1 methyl-accepting chemotaxis protein [Chitiniphilus sp. CD1]
MTDFIAEDTMPLSLTIRSRVIAFGCLATLLLLLLGLIGLISIRALNEGIEAGMISVSAVRNQGDADMMHDAIRADVLSAAHLRVEGATPQQFDEVVGELAEHIAKLRQDVADNEALPLSAQERQALASLKPDLERYAQQATALVQRYRSGQEDDRLYGEFKESFSRLEDSMARFSDLIGERAKAVSETQRAQSRSALIWAYGAMGGGVLLLGGLSWALSRGILRPLSRIQQFMLSLDNDLSRRCEDGARDETGDIARSANTLLGKLATLIGVVQQSARQVALTAKQLASQTATTRQRMLDASSRASTLAGEAGTLASSVDEVNQRIAGTTAVANDAATLAIESARALEEAMRINGQLRETASQSVLRINQLAESAERINQVATTIREIADQTNLLALNAAIEAARAGEQGRGFAVVADEVRKLAERTAVSTGDISQTTAQIQRCMTETVQSIELLSQQVGSSADRLSGASQAQQRIVAGTDEMRRIAQDIATAAQHQSEAIGSSVKGVQGIAALMAQSESEVDGIRQASNELDALAHSLQDNVGRFRV